MCQERRMFELISSPNWLARNQEEVIKFDPGNLEDSIHSKSSLNIIHWRIFELDNSDCTVFAERNSPLWSRWCEEDGKRSFLLHHHRGQLYRRGLSQPLLKCPSLDQTSLVLEEVHEGSCNHHSREKALALKVLQASYYWPTMIKDAVDFVKKLPKMPATRSFPHRTSWGALNDHVPMAILQIGNRPPRSISPCFRASKLFDCGHRLIHQMDRSGATILHSSNTNPKICFKDHLYLFWNVWICCDG